jgi:hypothetical protein
MTTNPLSSSSSQDSNLVSLFELAGRLALLTAALLYGIGFLVENMHLARFGYFALTLFERRYAFAGFWAVSPLLLYFLFMGITGYYRPTSGNRAANPWRRWLVHGGGFLAALIVLYAFQVSVSQILGISFPWLTWLPFVYGSGILAFIMTRRATAAWRELMVPSLATPESQTLQGSRWQVARSVLSKVEWVWTPVAVTYLVLFTYALFPTIPASWGGGGAETVQFLVSSEDAALFTMPVLTPSTAQLSSPMVLVATTADDYVILVDSTRVVYLSRDRVRAVTLNGRFRVPTRIRHPYSPRDSAQ